MARHDAYAQQGVGPILIARAFAQTLTIAQSSGSFALIVDAKNDALAKWYERLGFTPFLDRPRQLFIPNGVMAAYLERMNAF
jgi:ribosomal protein S18 acetylase RimI-like enzyme